MVSTHSIQINPVLSCPITNVSIFTIVLSTINLAYLLLSSQYTTNTLACNKYVFESEQIKFIDL